MSQSASSAEGGRFEGDGAGGADCAVEIHRDERDMVGRDLGADRATGRVHQAQQPRRTPALARHRLQLGHQFACQKLLGGLCDGGRADPERAGDVGSGTRPPGAQ
jgi:hypothetical protein